jgi:hypothetical protein
MACIRSGLATVNWWKRRIRKGAKRREAMGTIWKIKTPPKAKHLLWRICKDCLPTRIRLRNHLVQCQEEWPLCSQVTDVLVECEGSREAWNAMGLEHILTTML